MLENSFGMFGMSLFVGGEDKEVVHVDNQPSFHNHVAKGIIHETLKGSGGVA